MARLTNYERDSLVRRILADIPEVDYAAQMKSRAVEICIGLMPAPVRRIWENAELRGYLKSGSTNHCCMMLPTPGFGNYDDQVRSAFKVDDKLNAAHKLHDEQKLARDGLRQGLKANIYSCSTDTQFRERFPELAKYLPAASAAISNLPATTALIDSLRSAGLALEAA